MFLPPKLTTIVLNSLAILLLSAGISPAQQAEFNRRAMAMQEARARAQQPSQVRLASNDTDIGLDFTDPPSPPPANRIASVPTRQMTRPTTPMSGRARVQQATQRMAQQTMDSNQVSSRYVPEHMRTAQLMESAIVDGGAPVVENSVVVDPGYYDGQIIEGEVIDGGCASCGGSGTYFDQCDSCCGRGGCPPGDCWISGFGAVLRNAEYFGGAAAFRSSLFTNPNVESRDTLIDDNSHGYYGGFNVGLPLCKLSCGLFTTQFGIRSVQSNFNGSQYTIEDRDQTFATLGFFRRVDYGLQGGFAIDYLNEKWAQEVELAQFRGDVGWVYPSGKTFGFQYALNIDDANFIDDNSQNQLNTTENTYRFYVRALSDIYGEDEAFIGWTENNQWLIGADFDIPIRERLALESGFTYFHGDEMVPANSNQLGGNINDAFNIYVGFVFRPRGRSQYRNYDRPMFSVADNGSMLIRRF